MEELIISADSHVIEVPDLWEKGMPASLRDRAPKAFFDEKRDAWMFGSPEVPVQAVGGLFMAGQRPDQTREFSQGRFFRGPPRRLGPDCPHAKTWNRMAFPPKSFILVWDSVCIASKTPNFRKPCSEPTTIG